MPRERAKPDLASASPSARFLHAATETGLIATLLFAPAAFGVRHAWSEFYFLLLVTATCAMFAARLLLVPSIRFVWHWSFLPVTLYLALCALQVMPIPAELVALVSPNTIETREALRDPSLAPESWTTLSLYPHATLRHLRLLLAVAAIYIITVNVIRERKQILRMMYAIGGIGLLAAAYSLVQARYGNSLVYWMVPLTGAERAGTMVNRNNFGQFLLMSMGVVLALIFIELRKLKPGRAQYRQWLPWTSLSTEEKQWLLCLILALTILALALANAASRGALVALVFAGLAMALISARRSPDRPWPSLIAILGVLVISAAVMFGFDVIYQRFSADSTLYNVRWIIAKDLLTRAFPDFPLLGVGLGAHEFVYPKYQTLQTSNTVANADGEYPQILFETGAIGLSIVLAFLAILWRQIIATLGRLRDDPLAPALLGLGFGLLAVLIHSVADFGQRRPANAALTATVCGIIISITRRTARRRSAELEQSSPTAARTAAAPRLRLEPLLAAAVIGLLGLTLPSAHAAWKAETHWFLSDAANRRIATARVHSPELHAARIAHAADALAVDPNNAEYRYWLSLYRWQSAGRMLAEGPLDDEKLAVWNQLAPMMLADLRRVRRDCPTYGRAYRLEGLICRATGDTDRGTELIRQSCRLAPNNPYIALVAGIVEAEAGDFEASQERLRQALRLNPAWFSMVSSLYIEQFNRPDLVVDLAGNNPNRINHLATKLRNKPEHADLVRDLQSRAIQIIEDRCREPGASASDLAHLASIRKAQGRREEAADCYARALSLAYHELQWRIERARLLVELGRAAEAIQEVQICLRVQPNHPRAKQLLQELTGSNKAGTSKKAIAAEPQVR